MINRINLIMQAKNITASQFADEIKIQRSGMSHIMSGRNKPSLDFILRVLTRYPEISSDWLLFGKGEMYVAAQSAKNTENQQYTSENNNQIDLFSANNEEKNAKNEVSQESQNEEVAKQENQQANDNEELTKNPELNENSINETKQVEGEENQKQNEERKVERFLVLYNDHTFTEYTRSKD